MTINEIAFFGAAQTVTGSCHLIDCGDCHILIDCGMYQGKDVESRNHDNFVFNPIDIDYLILTHAHLDHCGLIPKLVRLGFHGKIFLTPQTAELSKVIMYDSAKLQDVKERIEGVVYNKLYDVHDVDKAVSMFVLVDEFQKIDLGAGITFELLPAGHILGSVSVFLVSNNVKLLFSGDLGRRNQSIIKRFSDYDFSKYSPDYIIMESLYGGLYHENRDADIDTLLSVINSTLGDKGKIIIPVFALHRAQEMLELIRYFFSRNKLPFGLNVFLDSPMAIEITKIYKDNFLKFNDHYRILGEDVEYSSDQGNGTVYASNVNRFDISQLKNIKNTKVSQRLNNDSSSIILAGSGMADGGRVARHLLNNLGDPKNSVVFVGYQAADTLGRELVDGAESVQINGKDVNVKARIFYLQGFSAHGDNDDLLSWLHSFGLDHLKQVFLVHGEPDRMLKFSKILADQNIVNSAPKFGEVFKI